MWFAVPNLAGASARFISCLFDFSKMRAKCILFVSSIFVALCIGEFLLQLNYFRENEVWLFARQDNFTVGYTKPVSGRRQYTLREEYADAELSIHETGFRNPVPEIGLSDELIVCVGDSVPFGAGVPDGETYPAVLGRLLQEEASSVKVINAGVPSYTLWQAAERFREEVWPRFRTQVKVVIIQAANDVSLASYYQEEWNPNLTWAYGRFGHMPGRGLSRHVALFHYLENVENLSKPREYLPYVGNEMVAAIRNEIRSLARFCERNSVNLVILPIDPFYYDSGDLDSRRNRALMAQPNFEKVGSYVAMWDVMIDEVNAMLEAEASRLGKNVRFLDTRNLLDRENRAEMFVDYIHYSSKGNSIVAAHLKNGISRFPLFSRFKPSLK